MTRKILLILKEKPSLLVLMICQTLLLNLVKFFPLILTAEVTAALIRKDYKSALLSLIVILVLMSFSENISSYMWKYISVIISKYNNQKIADLNNLAMTVSYESLQQNNLRGRIQDSKDIIYFEYDFSNIYEMVINYLEYFIQIMMSIYLVIQLLLQGINGKYGLLQFLIFLPMIFAFIIKSRVQKQSETKQTELLEEHRVIEGSLSYFLNGIIKNYAEYPIYHIFKLFHFLSSRIEKMGAANVDYFMKTRGLRIRKYSVQAGCIAIGTLCIYILVIAKAHLGLIAISMVLPYIQAFSLFQDGIFNVVKNSEDLRLAMPYIDRINELLKIETEDIDSGEKVPRGEPIWRFENVYYKYPNSEKWALENINFELGGNSLFALVGRNGSGKTTLVMLLSGLIKPTKGSIYYKGVNLDRLKMRDYRQELAVAFQMEELLPITLKENFFADSEIEESRAINILQRLGLRKLERIEHDDNLEASEFSGGEEQKILIARALCKSTREAFILDEPNSALDVFAQERLYREVLDLKGNRLLIFITHQLRVCRDCDHIIVIDKGKLSGLGSHEELLESNEAYRELWFHQEKLYSEA